MCLFAAKVPSVRRFTLLGLCALSVLCGSTSTSSRAADRLVGDLDNDGVFTALDLAKQIAHARGVAPLAESEAVYADVTRDGIVNSYDNGALVRLILETREPALLPLATIRETSPVVGESGVAVTREFVLHFTIPLALNTVISTHNPNTNTSGHLSATFAGRKILTRAELSSDRKKATLFFLEPLPAGARIRVTFDSLGLRDIIGRLVDGDRDGTAGGKASFTFDTLGISALPGTGVTGRVFGIDVGINNALTTRALPGVTITVDGAEQTLRTTTGADGSFTLTPAPTGRFFVLVDGRTAGGSGGYYAFVGKAWEGVAGRLDTPVTPATANTAAGDIYLPFIPGGTLQTVSATQDTTITFAPTVLAANPSLADVRITVPANSLFSDAGARGGQVGIAPVAPERLPEPLPPGLNLPLVITIQTDGATNFDRPVPVRFPNLTDPVTGVKLAAGAKSALWSFDHDKGHWEIAGPMTVTADGNFVETDRGVGVRQPGWHGTSAGTSGSGGPMGGSAGANGSSGSGGANGSSGGGAGSGSGSGSGSGAGGSGSGSGGSGSGGSGDGGEGDGGDSDSGTGLGELEIEPSDLDGDGIDDMDDTDLDGDGLPNDTDNDVDGDGHDNGVDSNDYDGDGIDNRDDSDMDGDGESNVVDLDPDGNGTNDNDVIDLTDTDGDGISDGDDSDVDGNGVPNSQEPELEVGVGELEFEDPPGGDGAEQSDGTDSNPNPDADGDGVPNGADGDMDGDGLANGEPTDLDGDGLDNLNDTDMDGDGVLNGSDSDQDGDGIDELPGDPQNPDPFLGYGYPADPDMDGDGVPNTSDLDMDGDGTTNDLDPDEDGDGVLNSMDYSVCSGGSAVTIRTGVTVSPTGVTALKRVLLLACLHKATIALGRRTSTEQAAFMFTLIETTGVANAKTQFAAAGDLVIDVHTTRKAAGDTDTQIKAAMRQKIIDLGPKNISDYCSDTREIFQVSPASLTDKPKFEIALATAKSNGAILDFAVPPADAGYRIEVTP